MNATLFLKDIIFISFQIFYIFQIFLELVINFSKAVSVHDFDGTYS